MTTKSRLQRFIHVGTAMACGPQAGLVVFEDYVPPIDVRHLVSYTSSKSEIEGLLRAQFPQLPLIVVRPSIIVGHTRYGCQPSGSIFWVFRLAQMLEKFTYEFDDPIDVVPVDYVAEAILHLLSKPELQHNIYHISAGQQGASTFREIDAAMAEGFGRSPVGERYQRTSVDVLRRRVFQLKENFSAGNQRLILRAIRLYGAFAELKMTFNNQRLIDEDMTSPPHFSAYASVCARSCRHLSLAEQMQADFK
jgi:nucleoside-diphosphate-sugar epimerase